ncbi:MAG: right-handed parallel beta-helix repeat-containing protein, partial [Pseudomonadota bacterium]
MNTYYIDPGASAGGDGSLENPFNSWDEVTITAGDTFLQKSGTDWAGTIRVAVATEEGDTTRIGTYGGDVPASIQGEIILDTASGVVIEGLEIHDSQTGGISVIGDTADVTIRDCEIRDSGVGMQLLNGTAENLRIEGCTLTGNDTAGVSATEFHGTSDNKIVLSGNQITQNGMQGVLLYANHWIVEYNEIHNNGLVGVPGTSGVHMIAETVDQEAGDYNIVRFNRISHQQDSDGWDGNGIQADHYSDFNIIHDNEIFLNDGAAVSVFDSEGTQVFNNFMYDNHLDPGFTHGEMGSIVLASRDINDDRTLNSEVYNNPIVVRNPAAAG